MQHDPSLLDDPALVVRAMAAKKRRWLMFITANVVLFALLVGGPYVRGHLRTRALWRELGSFGACLFDGSPAPEPALGMKRGAEGQFAAMVVSEDASWPARCEPTLARLAPPEVTFLLPSVKRAEADLRIAAELVKSELRKLASRTPGSRLSTRPLRAIEQLRAALARHALAAGVVFVPQQDAFSFGARPGLPQPSRIPLYAGYDAVVSLWGSESELHAVGVDRRGVSYVGVQAGRVTQHRMPREKLLMAFLRRGQDAGFVWAMPRARCEERVGGCAHKAMGLAPATVPVIALPTPRWLAGHPKGRIDRSLARTTSSIWLAAEASGGATDVRGFARFEPSADVDNADLPPLEAREQLSTGVHGDVLLLEQPERDRVLSLSASTQQGKTLLSRIEPRALTPLAELEGEGTGWVFGCAHGQIVDVIFGNDTRLMLGRLSNDAAPQLSTALALSTRHVVHDTDPARDKVLPLCSPERLVALVHDATERLFSVHCALTDGACESHLLAEGVHSFSALAIDGGALVAFAGLGEMAQIRVRTLDEGARPVGAERVPAACWSPAGGMCGAPLLTRIGERIVLGAREGADVLALESGDGGQHWEPLRGLRRSD